MTQRATRFDSLAEVYSRGNYAPFRRAMRVAGTAQVALVRFAQPAGAFPDPPTPDYTLARNERGAGRMRFDMGAGRVEVPFRRGDLVLKPPGVATRFAVDAPHEKSFVSLPAALVAEAALRAGAPADLGALHDAPFRCVQMTRVMDLLWAEPDGDSPQHRLFGDGAILALLALLFGRAPGRGAARTACALSPARLAIVAEFVEANLAESFGLAEMAAQAGLSAFHFSRAFKQATGLTPRGFVTARRVARAKRLLAEGRLPLAQVAQACGFADQAHLTTVFRRQTGLTPGAWRRAAE